MIAYVNNIHKKVLLLSEKKCISSIDVSLLVFQTHINQILITILWLDGPRWAAVAGNQLDWLDSSEINIGPPSRGIYATRWLVT